MEFENKIKLEFFRQIIEMLQEKILEEGVQTEEEKIRMAYQELIDPYKISGEIEVGSVNKAMLKDLIDKKVDATFNSRINCGGYALEMDTCIWGGHYKGKTARECLERNVSKILEFFPFVRLLGDTQLQEDEYLVEYRANNSGGHHFIKIKQNGDISDKNEASSPRRLNAIFDDEEKVWHDLKDCPRAVFAVKNNHIIYPEHPYGTYSLAEGLNFEDTVINAVKSGQDKFRYHNHEYIINQDQNGEEIILSNEERVATIIRDESGEVVVEEESKREYISNVNSKTYEDYIKKFRCKKSDSASKSIGTTDIEDIEFEL